MILDAEDGQVLVPHAFERLIVQVDVRQLDVAGKGLWVDGEPVVLSRDLDLAGPFVPDGVIGARCPNLSLKVFAPNAWPRSWWPRQMPKIGSPRDSTAVRISVLAYSWLPRERRDHPGRWR